jgi:hypothetical protein
MTDVFETRCQLVDSQNECDGCLVAARIKDPAARNRRRTTVAAAPSSEPTTAAVAAAVGGTPVSCEHIEELLSDLLDDQLAAGARGAVQAHVRACARCGRSYRALKRSVTFVRANSQPGLRHGSAGGVYAEFVRATMDPEHDADPVQTLIAGVADVLPERRPEIEQWDVLRGQQRREV